jgi:hypothetical protein
MTGDEHARWRQTLGTLGEDAVRHSIATRSPIVDTAGSNVPCGFADAWLEAKAAERQAWLTEKAVEWQKTESRRYTTVLIIAVIAAVAAVIAAMPVLASWVR